MDDIFIKIKSFLIDNFLEKDKKYLSDPENVILKNSSKEAHELYENFCKTFSIEP